MSPSLFHSDFVGEVQVAVNGPWCVAFGFTARSEFSDTDDVEAVTFDVGGRYYLLGRSTGGLAVGATAGAGMVEATFPTGPDKELAARAGLQTSGVWVPFGRLVLSAAVGMAYEHVSVHHGSRMMGHNGLAPQARAGIGISF